MDTRAMEAGRDFRAFVSGARLVRVYEEIGVVVVWNGSLTFRVWRIWEAEEAHMWTHGGPGFRSADHASDYIDQWMGENYGATPDDR